MNNDRFLEQHANETLTGARDFIARERLTRLGGTLEPGDMPNWLLVGAVILFIGLLIVAL